MFIVVDIVFESHGRTLASFVKRLGERDKMTKRTILDRSIKTVLSDADKTASRQDGVSIRQERLHRLQGTSLIFEATKILQLSSAAIYVTACTIFHRFYHQVSLHEIDVWSSAMASTLLACKTEEVAVPLRHVVLAFAHLYRRRRLVLLEVEEAQMVFQNLEVVDDGETTSKMQTLSEKLETLQKIPSMSLSPMGPLWKEWHTAVVQAEAKILRQLGFTLHWIPDQHPHKFLFYFLRILQVDDDKDFAQCAWNYCNDSCRVDLCVRFRSSLVACAAIHLASLDKQKMLPGTREKPWWEVFCGPGQDRDLSCISNAIIGLSDTQNIEILTASHGFVKSLMPKGSFNDPASFVWEYCNSL